MIEALEKMGTRIEGDGDDLTITPGPLTSAQIDVGLAGTVFRFLAAVGARSARSSTHLNSSASRSRLGMGLLAAPSRSL